MKSGNFCASKHPQQQIPGLFGLTRTLPCAGWPPPSAPCHIHLKFLSLRQKKKKEEKLSIPQLRLRTPLGLHPKPFPNPFWPGQPVSRFPEGFFGFFPGRFTRPGWVRSPDGVPSVRGCDFVVEFSRCGGWDPGPGLYRDDPGHQSRPWAPGV